MPRDANLEKRIQPATEDSAGIAFGELAELLGYRLRRAQVAMHRDFITAVAGLDLTQKQTGILWLINNNPGVSQVAVAGALDMDRATMMAVIDRLDARGFITRARSKIDRRCQELHLTLAGQSMLAKLKTRITKHEQRIRALFTPAEFDSLLAALLKLQRLD